MASPDEGNLHVRCQQHQDGVLRYLGQLLTSQAFADVTICCQNRRLKAHRILLSACSHYLQRVLLAHLDPDHITLILHDIDYCDMKLLLDFMYTGAVSVSREGLGRFLQAAETLQVRVLNQHALAKSDCDINTAINGTPRDLDVGLKTRTLSGEAEAGSKHEARQATVAALKQQQLSSATERRPGLRENAFQVREQGSCIYESAEKCLCSGTEHQTVYKKRGVCCNKDRYANLETKYAVPEANQHMFIHPQHTLAENKAMQVQPRSCSGKLGVTTDRRLNNAYHEDQKYESDLQHLLPNNHISGHPLITLCKEHQRFGHQGVPPWARPLPCLMPITPGVPEPPYLQLREGVRLRNGMQAAHVPLERVLTSNTVAQHGMARDDKVAPKLPRLTPILPPSPWAQRNRPPCVAPRAKNLAPVRHWNPGLPQETTGGPDSGPITPAPAAHRSKDSGTTQQSGGTKRGLEHPPVVCRLKERRLQEFYRDQRNTTVDPEEASDLSMKGSVSAGDTMSALPLPSDQQENGRGVEPRGDSTHHEETPFSAPSIAAWKLTSSHRVDEFAFSKPSICENLCLAEGKRTGDNCIQGINAEITKENEESAIKLDYDDEVIAVCDTMNDRNNNARCATPGDLAAVDGKTPHGCEDCGKCFSRRQLLVQHRRIHTGERPYTCAECGKQFTQRGHWSSHQKLHGPARRPEHTCPNCGKGFVTRASLKVHLRTHTGEKPFQCTECGKQFSQLRNYKYHRSVHEGTREFAATCPECGKYFNDRGYLSSHMKIHRNRKEYACQYCGKSFNQRVAYNMHVRIHTGERPHSCQHCNKSFSRKMLLKQHLRIHTGEKPFACEVCGKAFADRSNMTLHMRLHSGIKPYTCSTCNKSFTKKHHLKTHMNYHTGIKPYACSKCGLRFSQSSNMRTHYKKCSADNIDEGTPEGSLQNIGSVLTPTSSPSSSANDVTRTTLPSDVITPPHSDESSCSSPVITTNQTDK